MQRVWFPNSMRASVASTNKKWRPSSSVIIAAPSSAVPAITGLDVPEDPVTDYKVCLVRRAPKSTFMASVSVFPGGAIDPVDKEMATQLCGRCDDEAVAMVAAAREAFEESGVAIASASFRDLSGAEISEWRAKIRVNPCMLAELYAKFGAAPALSQMHKVCSFITPDMEHKRLKKGGFQTQFYLFCCNDRGTLAHARADKSETVSLAWLSPRQALTASDMGLIFLAPPQWFILNDMASCTSISELPTLMASDNPIRQLVREYPIKPYAAQLDPADQGEYEMALVYPVCSSTMFVLSFVPPQLISRGLLVVGSVGRVTQHILYSLDQHTPGIG